jgi:hypothetical protein
MSTKRLPKGDTKGKVEGSDELTAQRIRAILESPDTPKRVKERIEHLVGLYYGTSWADTLPEPPEYFALEFDAAEYAHRHEQSNGHPIDKADRARAELAAYVEKHEPKDARLIRRLSEILADEKTDKETYHRIGYLICELSNETGTDDLEPEIFPTLARVYFRKARAAAKGGTPARLPPPGSRTMTRTSPAWSR